MAKLVAGPALAGVTVDAGNAAVRAIPRSALESILLESAAKHPSVAVLLQHHAAAAVASSFTVTAMSHSRVALDGDATPSAVGRLVTVHGTGFVVGSATARCNVSSTDTFEGFQRGFAYDPEHVLRVPAKVVSPTSLTCLLPRVPTGGPAHVLVSMDDGKTFPTVPANFTYFALVSFAVGRRPYTVEQQGNLIVGIAPELLQTATASSSEAVPSLWASATVVSGAKALQVPLATNFLTAHDSVLSFPLAAFPKQLDAVVTLTVSVQHGINVTKSRRLVRVPLEPDQEAVVVDHHTRGLAIVKPVYDSKEVPPAQRQAKAWLGTGWYMYGGFECNGQSHAPAIDWGNAPGPGNFSGHVDLLARRGFNQIMIYDLETLSCGRALEATLLPLMDRIADVGIRVMVSVKQWMQQSPESSTGGPGSTSYESLRNVTTLLKNHRALLGWYCYSGQHASVL
eukprot:COSAG05_NODE_2927_length_2496_cov_1.884022_3_plen_454_part_00